MGTFLYRAVQAVAAASTILGLPETWATAKRLRSGAAADVPMMDYLSGPGLVLFGIALFLLAVFFERRSHTKDEGATAGIHGEASNRGRGFAVGVNTGTMQISYSGQDPAQLERLASRWRQLTPEIDKWIGAGRRIQEEMRNEGNPTGTLDSYVDLLENGRTGWRTLAANFLDAEFPNTGLRGLVIVKGTNTKGLSKFAWELERLTISIGKLLWLKQPDTLTHYIQMSGKYN